MTRTTDLIVVAALAAAGTATLVGLNPSVLPPWRYHVASDYVAWQPPALVDSSGDEHRTSMPSRLVPEWVLGDPIRFVLGSFIVIWPDSEGTTNP